MSRLCNTLVVDMRRCVDEELTTQEVVQTSLNQSHHLQLPPLVHRSDWRIGRRSETKDRLPGAGADLRSSEGGGGGGNQCCPRRCTCHRWAR